MFFCCLNSVKRKTSADVKNLNDILLGNCEFSEFSGTILGLSTTNDGDYDEGNHTNDVDDARDGKDRVNIRDSTFSDVGNGSFLTSLGASVGHSVMKWAMLVNCSSLILRAGDVERNPGPNDILNLAPAFNPVTQALPRDVALEGRERQRDAGRDDHRRATHRQRDERDEGEPEGAPGKNFNAKCDLRVTTLNVRGLGCSKKVRHLVNTCYKSNKQACDNVYMFQETYVSRLELLRYLWRGEYHLTAGTGNSLGCITLLTAPYKIVHSVDLGQRGHVLAVTKDSLNKVDVILANVYAPNGLDNEKRNFFDELVDTLNELKNLYSCNNLIIGGDLNLVFNENEVKNRAYTNAEKRISNEVKLMFDQIEVTDGWQKVGPCFTWTTNRTGQQSFSTLDRIYYSPAYLKLIKQVADWSLSVSDHAAVIASYALVKQRCTNSVSIPRLDPRMLQDLEATTMMDEIFQEMFEQRSAGWSPHVSLEYTKMCIRTAANTATGKLKAKYRDEERCVNESLNFVVTELAKENISRDEKELLMHKLDDLRQLKRSLVEKIGAKLERKTARKWYNEGELSSKYFFNLMTRKTNDKIEAIVRDNGDELTNEAEIENEIRGFYKNLYESVPDQIDINDDIFRHVDPVAQVDAGVMEERLTPDELEETLKTCADSAPGPDGIPYSFLRHFWPKFGPILVAAWNYSLDTHQLPPSHKVSFLRLIPKAGKDCKRIGNLRPITLSNTDHKLITKTYAKKLTDLVADYIGEEQTAYIPGRLINDNVRAMLTTIDLANDADVDVDGVVVSLDAKKAFDSVDHRYIKRCLAAFGLNCFIPIFEILYKDLKSEIILNGRTVNGYRILKGVKQGDALSCILFILCMEPLIRNVKNNRNIERIVSVKLPIAIPNVYGYADDVTVVTKRNREGVQSIFNEYESFSKCSGLVLNADKTDVLCFNGDRIQDHVFNVTYLGQMYQLRGLEQIKINGILFQQDPTMRELRNVEKAIAAMERHLVSWSTRHLTLLGKILIIKTFAVSQIIYLLQSMSISELHYKNIMKVIYKYLWNRNYRAAKAPERIKRSIMLTPVSLGGFGMIDIKELGDSLDLRSYGRMMKSSHPFFAQIRELVKNDNFFNAEVNFSVDFKTKMAVRLLNKNRCEILSWPSERIVSSSNLATVLLNMPLAKVISPLGRQSLAYLMIRRRNVNALIRQLTLNELRSVERFIIYPELGGICRALLMAPHQPNLNINSKDIYPCNSVIVNISSLTSKTLRQNLSNEASKIICLYKIGLALDPGEVSSWTNRLRKLTSTRHKNILLRTVHGDIFSNSRLYKFGLRTSPNCSNCPEAVETIQHRIFECPKAAQAWLKLNEIKSELNLSPLTDLTLENLVGAKDRLSKIELALNAELILKLTSRSEGYCPEQVVRATIQLIGNSEYLKPELRNNLRTVLERH